MENEELIRRNLLRHRAQAGLNQSQLAEKAGLSRNAYRKIELAETIPRIESLSKIVAALGIQISDLLRPLPELQSLRFRSKADSTKKMAADREALISSADRWLKNIISLEELLESPWAPPDWLEQDFESPRHAAVVARNELSIAHSAVGICDLLEKHIRFYFFNSSQPKVFGFSIGKEDGGPVIAVNIRKDISVERWIFTTAHELGHILLHRESYGRDRADENPEEEKEANTFAAQFLMPDEAFKAKWDDMSGLLLYDRVMKMKRHFLVSYQSVIYRLVELGLARKTIWPHFNKLLQERQEKKITRKEEPEPQPEAMFSKAWQRALEVHPLDDYDFWDDRQDKLVRDALLRELITTSRAAEILGCSVEKMKLRKEGWALEQTGEY